MKLSHLFERDITVPVTVEYDDIEVETPDGDVEYHPAVFEIKVTVTTDMYVTGDSPTGYHVDIVKSYFKETGKPLDWTKIEKSVIEYIREKAIEKAKEQL